MFGKLPIFTIIVFFIILYFIWFKYDTYQTFRQLNQSINSLVDYITLLTNDLETLKKFHYHQHCTNNHILQPNKQFNMPFEDIRQFSSFIVPNSSSNNLFSFPFPFHNNDDLDNDSLIQISETVNSDDDNRDDDDNQLNDDVVQEIKNKDEHENSDILHDFKLIEVDQSSMIVHDDNENNNNSDNDDNENSDNDDNESDDNENDDNDDKNESMKPMFHIPEKSILKKMKLADLRQLVVHNKLATMEEAHKKSKLLLLQMIQSFSS